MPGYKTAKYSKEYSAEIATTAFAVLDEAKTSLTIPEIQAGDITLVGVTPQKISRELSKYVEMGLLVKGKRNGKVTYEVKE